jgi:hypothetical protein
VIIQQPEAQESAHGVAQPCYKHPGNRLRGIFHRPIVDVAFEFGVLLSDPAVC